MSSQSTNFTDGQTDGRTDGRHATPIPRRICTKVHCAVKIIFVNYEAPEFPSSGPGSGEPPEPVNPALYIFPLVVIGIVRFCTLSCTVSRFQRYGGLGREPDVEVKFRCKVYIYIIVIKCTKMRAKRLRPALVKVVIVYPLYVYETNTKIIDINIKNYSLSKC